MFPAIVVVVPTLIVVRLLARAAGRWMHGR